MPAEVSTDGSDPSAAPENVSTRGGGTSRGEKTVSDTAVDRAIFAGAGGKILMTVFSLVVVAIATRSLGPSGFGVVAVLLGLVTALGFLDLGIGNAAIGAISASLARGDMARARSDVATALAAMAGIGTAVAVVGSVIALCLPRRLLFSTPGVSDVDLRLSLLAFAISLGVAIPASLGSRIALAREHGATNNVYLILGAAASLVATVMCGVGDAPVWVFTVAVVLVPNVILAAQTVLLTTTSSHAVVPDFRSVTLSRVREVGRASAAFMILGACSALSFQTNALVVAYVLDSRAAGILGVATRAFSLVSTLFVGGLQQSWASTARAMAAGQMDWTRRNFWRVLRLTGVPVAILSVLLVVVGQPLIRVWAGSASEPPVILLILLAVWTVYNFVMTQTSFLLNAANVLRPQVYLAVALLLVSVPSGIVLTHLVGIAGSTLAVLLSHVLIVAVPFLLLGRRILRLPEGTPIDNNWRSA